MMPPPRSSKTPFFLIAVQPLDFEGAHRRYLKELLGDKPQCIGCGSFDGVASEESRTRYEWDGQGVDPNRSIPLCRPCASMHHQNMDDQWATYYEGFFPRVQLSNGAQDDYK
jgi:hypothetical protein